MLLGQAEPALQIEIVVDLIEGVIASKEAGAEAPHQHSHLSMDRIAVAVDASEDTGRSLVQEAGAWRSSACAIYRSGTNGRVPAHGGRIQAESAGEGQGSLFTLSIWEH